MRKLRYGNYGQVMFDSWEEYYYVLGFLANSNNAEIYWENNDESGAWGSEGRIHCLLPEERFPQCFKFTAGNGSAYARINCNEYVNNLISTHHFREGGNSGNIQDIADTVPEKYLNSFRKGFGREIPQKTLHKTENKPKPIYTNPNIRVGKQVQHSSYGRGIISELSDKYLTVNFNDGLKKFQNPEAFINGYLKIVGS